MAQALLDPRHGLSKKKIIAAWASFDFANSSFAVIMVAFVFPIYFGKVITGPDYGDLYWSWTMSLSMLLVVLTAPILGAMADLRANKKQYLLGFTLLSVICTAALYFVQPGMIAVAMALFVLANAGFEGGLVFYDAFLPEIANESEYGKVSSIGFAVGYVGSLVAVLLAMPLLLNGKEKETFVLSAFLFLIFAIPTFRYLPEHRTGRSAKLAETIRYGFDKVFTTIRHIRRYKNVARFLLAFFVFNDAILTVIGFAGRFADQTLHFSMAQLVMFFLMIQTVAAIGSIITGRFADRTGLKVSITFTLIMWLVVIAGAYFTTTATEFYLVGAIAGLGLGASQAASRAMMAKLSPIEYRAEFFGFYEGFCGKASAIVGPLIFGVISTGYGQRAAVLSVGAIFLLGLTLLQRVKEVPHPRLATV